MTRNDKFFTPETVDEDIEQLSRTSRAATPGRRQPAERQLIQSLRRLYETDKADERSIAAVWERLAQQHPAARSRRRSPGPSADRAWSQAGQRYPQAAVTAARARRGWSYRLAALVAAALLVVVVAGLVVGLVLVGPHDHQLASQPTPTGVPLSHQSVYIYTGDGLVIALNAATGVVRWSHHCLGKLSPLNLSENSIPPMTLYKGALYIASEGGIEAIRTRDGSLLWQQKIGMTFSAPIVSNGVVYVSSETLYAFSATDGKLLWSQEAPSSFSIALAAADGNLYVLDAATHAFEALKATNGTLLWKVDDTKSYFGEFGGTAGGVVYLYKGGQVLSRAGPNLYALNASDGSLRWTTSNDHEPSILSITNDVIYIQVEMSFTDQRIYALNASDGSVRWQLQSHDTSSPLTQLVDNVVYVETDDGFVHAFSASNGSKLWDSSVIQGRGYARLAGVAQGFAYVSNTASPTYELYALRLSDGAIQWKKALAGGIYGGSGGLVYVINTRILYAFNSQNGSVRWTYSQPELNQPAIVDDTAS
jgi:outer membrane protein assembly factor BamB